MLFFFRFLNSVDVIELGGFDELSGKGYELCLFLFSDVLEISKKKSASKGLGLRSPSTMSLRTMGAGTLTNNGKSMEFRVISFFHGVSNCFTGKSFSEALILASTNPQCDKRLFMELP